MKQFLRYQISGSVFIFWIVVFYYGKDTANPIDLIKIIYTKLDGIKSILGFVSALPIGVLIHQISVQIKNCIIGQIWKEFIDFPKESRINSSSENKTYILDRISNLNSFYYVRFDNGLLAPFFSYLIVHNYIEQPIHTFWLLLSLSLGAIINLYLIRIYKEMKKYDLLLVKNEDITNRSSQ